MRPHLFIFGLGYSSLAIARLAMLRDFKVSGTTRDAAKAIQLQRMGIETVIFPLSLLIPDDVTHILSSIPPQEDGDITLKQIANYEIRNTWLGYLSTTGVYGDYQGAWVDETSELRPNNDRLRRRVEAEKQWLARGGHVFRLAGIYGERRNALADIQAGHARRIHKENQVFSRIHVEDIAQVVVASMLNPNAGNVYNVCDDEPAPAHQVVEYGCELLGVAPPPLVPYEQADLSAMGREFYASNRRVRNDKIKKELGVTPRYPTYREGLDALARSLQTNDETDATDATR